MVPCTPCTHRYLTPRAPACARVHARVLVSRAYTRAVCSTLGGGVPAIVESAALEFPNDSPGLPSAPPVPPKQAQRTRALARTSHARPRAHTRHARTRTARPCACPRHAPAHALPTPCHVTSRSETQAVPTGANCITHFGHSAHWFTHFSGYSVSH